MASLGRSSSHPPRQHRSDQEKARLDAERTVLQGEDQIHLGLAVYGHVPPFRVALRFHDDRREPLGGGALREALPEKLGGLYDAAEMKDVVDVEYMVEA
ncbi:MAG: hypothetical protein WDA41_09150 [Candidatus Neomarinimicrobiota bacterium]